MRSLEEILKQSGSLSAMPPARVADRGEDAAPAPEPEETEVCPDCGGAGFVRRAVRLGHPDFGKAFPCRCIQNEREDERLARLQRYSNLGPLARLTFANLVSCGRSPDPRHQERFAEAVRAAQAFAEAPQGWLVLTGPSGCGKTHLAAALAGRCVERGQAALFMVVPDLLDHLRSAYRPESDVSYDELFELVKNAQVLILDDLGVQSSTPWAQEKLFQVINHRYNAQLPTVFTTNLDLREFDQRLQSRLTDPALARVFHLECGPGAAVDDVDALILPLLGAMTFKSFNPRLLAADNDELVDIQKSYRQAMNFAQEPRDWLVIAGATGRGKTRLAAGIGNYCREAGMRVMFVVVPDLLDHLRSSYDPQNARGFDSLLDRVRNMPLLILDDLGSQSGTPWAAEKLFQIVNHRYNAQLPTVFTTNLTVKEIEPRLATRLTDPKVSTILLMGRFDIWGGHAGVAARPAPGPSRGRPRRG